MLSGPGKEKHRRFADDDGGLVRLQNRKRAAAKNVQMSKHLRSMVTGSSTQLAREKHSRRKREAG
jgi:hypothetical protein